MNTDVERHVPSVYTTRGAAWVVCACGWTSVRHGSQVQAQMAWSMHVREVLLARPDGEVEQGGGLGR